MTIALTRRAFRRATTAFAWTLTAGLLVALGAGSTPTHDTTADGLVLVAEPFDPEVILPGRVDAALHRTWDGVQRSVATVDDRQYRKARKALRATRAGFGRSLAAVLHQVEATPPPDAEEESTAGPDSALAYLNVSGSSVHMLAGLYDGVRAPRLLKGITSALVADQQRRARLITTLTALDPEEAGAPYADALIDTVPNYTDEVASLDEALQDDVLTPAARTALREARARSRAAEAAMLAAYGGSD
jgi:hypothetical protein